LVDQLINKKSAGEKMVELQRGWECPYQTFESLSQNS
jgi:hypothetical protein